MQTFPRVEPKSCLPSILVWTVAGETVLGKDPTNVSIEIYFTGSCPSYSADAEKCDNCDKPTGAKRRLQRETG